MLDAAWRKSSHSGEETACVEVRLAGVSQIRDTKDRRGGTLSVTTRSWEAFLGFVRAEAAGPPPRRSGGFRATS